MQVTILDISYKTHYSYKFSKLLHILFEMRRGCNKFKQISIFKYMDLKSIQTIQKLFMQVAHKNDTFVSLT